MRASAFDERSVVARLAAGQASAVFGIVVLCLVVVAARLVISSLIGFEGRARWGDDGHDGYWQLAQMMSTQGVFGFTSDLPATTRAPLFALLLVPGFWMGVPELWAGVLQLSLACAAAGAVFLFGTRFVGVRAAWAGGILVATYPWLLWMTKNSLPYVLLTALAASLLLVTGLVVEEPRRRRWVVACGVLLGLLTLTHAAWQAFIPPYLLTLTVVLARRASAARAFRVAALMGVTAVAVITPWTIRNRMVDPTRWTPVTSGVGLQYFRGKNAVDAARTGLPPTWNDERIARDHGIDPAQLRIAYGTVIDPRINRELDRRVGPDFFGRLRNSPGEVVSAVLINTAWFWTWDVNTTLQVLHILYLLLVAAGWALAWRRRTFPPAVMVMGVGLLAIWAVHSVTMARIAHASYTIALYPALFAGAAACLARSRRTAAAETPARGSRSVAVGVPEMPGELSR